MTTSTSTSTSTSTCSVQRAARRWSTIALVGALAASCAAGGPGSDPASGTGSEPTASGDAGALPDDGPAARWDDVLDRSLLFVGEPDEYDVFYVLTFAEDVVGSGTGFPAEIWPADQAAFAEFFASRIELVPGTGGCPMTITDDGWLRIGYGSDEPFGIDNVVDEVAPDRLTVTETSRYNGHVSTTTYTGYPAPDAAAVQARRGTDCTIDEATRSEVTERLLAER